MEVSFRKQNLSAFERTVIKRDINVRIKLPIPTPTHWKRRAKDTKNSERPCQATALETITGVRE